MSDNIPFEIQVEIIKLLPVKSLIRFRSVSKAWKSLIDSSDFITYYRSQQQHLIVSYKDSDSSENKFLSIPDDDTFPQHKVSLTVPQLDLLVNWLERFKPIGCSHGLLCLYSDYQKGRVGPFREKGLGLAVIWNPSIRKAVAVVVPDVENGEIYGTVLGFGVCGETSDPKLVKITHVEDWDVMDSTTYIPWQVEVYSLSTGVWRSLCNNLPRISIQFVGSQIVVGGVHYWLGIERVYLNDIVLDDSDEEVDDSELFDNVIVAFDMTREEFREVSLPESLAEGRVYLYLSKLRESLVVLEQSARSNNVWMMMMEDGVPSSFTKLFSINVISPYDALIKGFRECGEVIVKTPEDGLGIYRPFFFEPYPNYVDDLGIDRIKGSFFVYSYVETLLLLDQPNLTVYTEKENLHI